MAAETKNRRVLPWLKHGDPADARAIARSFYRARRRGEYGELADSDVKGTVGSTVTLAAVAAAGAAGGSAGLVLLW